MVKYMYCLVLFFYMRALQILRRARTALVTFKNSAFARYNALTLKYSVDPKKIVQKTPEILLKFINTYFIVFKLLY